MISIIASHHAEAFPEGDFDVLHPMTELIRYCKLCVEHDVRPEFEIWHSGSIWNLQYLLDHTELARPVINTLFFGWPGGTWSPPTIEEYLARRQLMPPDCVVTVSVMGPERYGILAAAITSGDHVRVGTEDYGYDRWGGGGGGGGGGPPRRGRENGGGGPRPAEDGPHGIAAGGPGPPEADHHR